MITLQNLSFSYANSLILDDISCQIAPGTCLGIIGRNGSGKTTLLQLILGVLAPSSGRILLNDHVVLEISAKERAKLMAWVAPELASLFRYSVFDLVSMGRSPFTTWWGVLSQEDQFYIQEALESTQITHLQDRLYDSLSAGEKQRVNLARAIAQQTPYLLLDEPYNHLDLACQYHFTQLLQIIRAQHPDKTIILVSHHIDPMKTLCDQVAVIESGRLMQLDVPDVVLSQQNLERVFLN